MHMTMHMDMVMMNGGYEKKPKESKEEEATISWDNGPSGITNNINTTMMLGSSNQVFQVRMRPGDDDDDEEELEDEDSRPRQRRKIVTTATTTTSKEEVEEGESSSSSSGSWLQLGLPCTTTNNSTTPTIMIASPLHLMLDLNLAAPHTTTTTTTTPIILTSPSHTTTHHHASTYFPSNSSNSSTSSFSHFKSIHHPPPPPFPSSPPHPAIWFTLLPSLPQSVHPYLPHLSKNFLRIKDATMTVGLVMKYLAHKLGLHNQLQVEIKCRGQVLMPFLTLQHVRDRIWSPSHALTLLPNSSTSPHLMLLHYSSSSSSSTYLPSVSSKVCI